MKSTLTVSGLGFFRQNADFRFDALPFDEKKYVIFFLVTCASILLQFFCVWSELFDVFLCNESKEGKKKLFKSIFRGFVKDFSLMPNTSKFESHLVSCLE